jgi:hypothetical protein
VRSFGVEERRRRLARRHGLAERLASVEAVTEALVVLHATDPATVYLSVLARAENPSLEAVDKALYDDRTIMRTMAMRRTLFVAPVPHLAAVELSSAPAVAAVERRKLLQYLTESGLADPLRWLTDAMAEIETALAELAAQGRGAPARQITTLVPRLETKLSLGAGSPYAVSANATSRVLGLMAVEGRLVRGRPTGNWTTRQYQWHLRQHWLGGATPASSAAVAVAVAAGGQEPATASAELVRRWLWSFGPAPFEDLRWWTGWTVGRLRRALSALDVAEVDLAGTPGLVLADDLEPEAGPQGPWVALLPSLDPTPMGWKHRDWYLGPHRPVLFDRSGNIGPTVWADGRIVGGWSQRPDGTIVHRLLEDVDADHRHLIEAEAEWLAGLIAPTVVKPSFPTPLQKELSSG